MIDIVVDPAFNGPNILDLEFSLSEISAPMVDVRWTNTKPEFYVFQKYKGKKSFRLHVADLGQQERASAFLGKSLPLDKSIIERGKHSINSGNWREYANELGASVTRSVVTKIAADAIREGRTVKLAKVASDCQTRNINPVDADVLFRLRVLQG